MGDNKVHLNYLQLFPLTLLNKSDKMYLSVRWLGKRGTWSPSDKINLNEKWKIDEAVPVVFVSMYLLDIDTPLGLSTSAIVVLSIININVYEMPWFMLRWGKLIKITLLFRMHNISKADTVRKRGMALFHWLLFLTWERPNLGYRPSSGNLNPRVFRFLNF